MELLQKLTLYDLLVYTLPGTVLLMIWKQEDLQQVSEAGAADIILFLAVGFLTGVMISEIMSWLEKIIENFHTERQWKKVCEKYTLSEERIREALQNARIISEISDEDEGEKTNCARYCMAMFADIQADPKYSRIHNYASAALLYRNMVLTAAFCMAAGAVRSSCGQIVAGIVGMICFSVRWRKFQIKEVGYAICWFIEKYEKELS